MNVRRKVLIALVGGVLTAPRTPLAQLPARPRRVGILWEAEEIPPFFDEFNAGLRELGYVQGRDYVFEQRSAKGDPRLLKPLAAELLALKVDLIVATGTQSAMAARGTSRVVPIVFTGAADPVGSGLADSLRRPGGNATGFGTQNTELATKHLDLLRQIVPNLRRVGYLYNADSAANVATLAGLEPGCGKLQIQCIRAAVRELRDIPGAFGALQRDKVQGLIVAGNPALAAWRDTIIDHAARHQLPATYFTRIMAEHGGLIAYTSSLEARFRRAAAYADKIFKGAKPGDLPIEQPTKFELVVNLRTARALGITIPQSILVSADKVIQ